MAQWYETQVRCKPGKVVVKLRDDDGRFQQSVIVPTVMYPLNEAYEIFHAGNTSRAGEEINEAIDKVTYKIGHCYSNTQNVVRELRKAGFDPVPYAGWLFVGEQLPIHHCWAVMNGNVIVDLCDDFPMQKAIQPDIDTLHGDALKKAYSDYVRISKQWPNSVRCYPIGQPVPWWLYVGCPCEPEDAVHIWKRLIKDHPNHECRRDPYPGNMSETQWYLHEQGLM